jgi:hypothetical protein
MAATPTKLGTKSRKVWKGITESYELRADELQILEDACREIDLCEQMEAKLALDAELVVTGSMGQPVAHPMVAELRQHRSTVQRLLSSLRLPADEEAAAAQSRSASARDLAKARWRRTG